jgi:hypothetical protein
MLAFGAGDAPRISCAWLHRRRSARNRRVTPPPLGRSIA